MSTISVASLKCAIYKLYARSWKKVTWNGISKRESSGRATTAYSAYSNDLGNNATLFQPPNVTDLSTRGRWSAGVRSWRKQSNSPQEAQRCDPRRLALARAADYAALLQTRSSSRRDATRRQGDEHRLHRESQPRRRRQRDDEMSARHVAASPWKTTRPGSRMRD